jgi:putative hydrolase of the HAD superfamily
MELKKDIEKYAVFIDASGTILGSTTSNSLGVQVLPDAIQILNSLKNRNINGILIKTGIITNWGNKINAMLKALCIDNCFDIVVSSDTVMRGKPDASVFHHACMLVGVDTNNAIHIGDSLQDDALGAQMAGLHGIWIRRGEYLHKDSEFLKHPFFYNLNDALSYIGNKIII